MPAFQEVIDGPAEPDPRITTLGYSILVKDQLSGLCLGYRKRQTEAAQLEENNPLVPNYGIQVPEKFRLTSWVESSSSKLGHALALTIAPEESSEPAVSGQFYVVDRELHHVIQPQSPIKLTEPFPEEGSPSHDQAIENIRNVLDRDELILVKAMLLKATVAFYNDSGHLDADVANAFINSRDLIYHGAVLDTLAADYPGQRESTGTPKSYEHILESVDFQAAAHRRLKTMPTHGKVSQDVRYLHLQHTVEDVSYFIELEAMDDDLTTAILIKHSGRDGSSVDYHTFGSEIDDEETASNQVWDIKLLLSVLEEGSTISPVLFKSYHDHVIDREDFDNTSRQPPFFNGLPMLGPNPEDDQPEQ